MSALFIDVKGTFNHINLRKLIITMIELGLDRDLIQQVLSFLTTRQVQLIIDNIKRLTHSINSGVP